jgi:pyruvate dehydrogenase E2 component (dihydrolipoamide acetyltransferase)
VLSVELSRVQGSGPGGRILDADVHAYVKLVMGTPCATASQVELASGRVPTALAAAGGGVPGLKLLPLPDFSRFGPVERRPVSGMRKATAEAMTRAWALVPMVTQFDSADVTDLEAARKRMLSGKHAPKVRITVTVLAMKAVVAALKLMPQFNASFDHEAGELVLKKYFNLGVAVDTEHGLVVPVIREADKKSVQDLAAELDMLAEKARARKLTLQDMSGASFTISNLGGIGGTGFTPIVNWPEVAILGISRSRKEFVWQEGAEGEPTSHEASAVQGEFRLTLPLSLSYDHRVIDGADGARFLRKVSELLSDPLQILMQA